MFAHKLNHPIAAVTVAIGIAAAAAVVWKRQSATYPLGIKSDRLEIAPQIDCSQATWPYGCDWQFNPPPEPPKHSRFGRRGQRHHALPRSLS